MGKTSLFGPRSRPSQTPRRSRSSGGGRAGTARARPGSGPGCRPSTTWSRGRAPRPWPPPARPGAAGGPGPRPRAARRRRRTRPPSPAAARRRGPVGGGPGRRPAGGARAGRPPVGRRVHVRPARPVVAAGRGPALVIWRRTATTSSTTSPAGPAGRPRLTRRPHPPRGADRRGVEDLVAAIWDPDAPAPAPGLHRRTGGHPLFVSELARLPEVGAGGPLPTVVTGAVARRLDGFDRTRRRPRRRQRAGQPTAARRAGEARSGPPRGGRSGSTPPGTPAWSAASRRTSSGSPTTSTARASTRSSTGERAGCTAGSAPPSMARPGPGRAGAAGRSGPPLHPGAHGTTDPGQAIRWAREAAADDRRRAAFTEAAGHLVGSERRCPTPGWPIEPRPARAAPARRGRHPGPLRRARPGTPPPGRGCRPRPTGGSADVALAVQRLGARFATLATRSSPSSRRRARR